jgi:sterol desaturase/sphingolipid hydroxylase (fatty acid hydroxylase superfamily)
VLRSLRQAHEVHHRYPLVNFGTTTTVWDRLFGTYAQTQPATDRTS